MAFGLWSLLSTVCARLLLFSLLPRVSGEMKQASVFGILFSSSYPHHPLPTSYFPQLWWPNTTVPMAYPEGHAVLTEEPRFLARRGDRAVIGKCRIYGHKLKLWEKRLSEDKVRKEAGSFWRHNEQRFEVGRKEWRRRRRRWGEGQWREGSV